MPRAFATPLYTTEILGLAVELASYPLDTRAPLQGSARSRSCGSVLDIGLDIDRDGQITGCGLKVAACAIGQASAALFARHAPGRDTAGIVLTLRQLETWLEGAGPMPDWPQLSLLEPARPYSARHGAILLPWKAAVQALSKASDRG